MHVQESSASGSRAKRERKARARIVVNVSDPMLRPRDVVKAVGLSRSTVYRMVRRGDFPEPVRLTDTAIGWTESSVRAWIRKRSASNVAEMVG